ncbi:hydantoinase/oxoprolinase family protein [Rhodococcus wratislaviensis]|uniref:Hydantoinase A n=1 Tax=Rhodococcus wratislaviensis NBRC 100605 TaxID=1219028 RepID=X0PMJ6_RHOWR|nr:hydantoinase/oxoprolinase family protein [Rhodococcus wratislaviensis]GAF43688.1 hydantoinase A [Rhodococcus wratislaviensis NBRC 100605]
MSDTHSLDQPQSWFVGGDVGGTFTDLIAWKEGEVPRIAKVATTPENQARALLTGITDAVPEAGHPDIAEVVHGTTVATNAILERKGVRTALITNVGFRDVLEMGRRTRPNVYGLRGEFIPHIPRWWRYEVSGRLDRFGNEIEAVDEAEIRKIAQQIAKEDVDAVGVVLLHSYANRAHEDVVVRILEEELPDVVISASVDILPEVGEFERTAATALNAYVEPLLTRYLGELVEKLRELAPQARVRVMQGNGGTVPVEGTKGFPIRSVISGPAAGMAGAQRVLSELGIDNAITCDMGGTSFDVGIVENGRPVATTELELEYNVPIKIPTLDIRTIGAGGGSIAYLDDGGMLRVGPISAGADPGPIWYGKGGRRLTVTDANVLAGRLKALTLGTGMRLATTPEEIWEIVSEEQPDLVKAFPTSEELSNAVIQVIVATMSACVRDLTVRRGRDPKDYAIVAYGGAGALHAAEIAKDLGIGRVVVPAFPGLLCAYGALVADYALDSVVTIRGPLATLDMQKTEETVRNEERQLVEKLREFEGMDVETRVFYECQFDHQTHSIYVEAPIGVSTYDLEKAFIQSYLQQFGDLLPSSAIVLRSVRVEARCKRRGAESWSLRDAVSSTELAPPADAAYWRPALREGDVIEGPTTISAVDASVTVPAGCVAHVVAAGHIIIEVNS